MPTILLINDDPSLAELLMVALGRYKIDTSDGLAALYQVVVEKPDLVLIDLKLPGVDGLTLIGVIRASSKVPVIVLSARHEPADVVQALQAGADDVIAKPFDLDDLEARIEAVLRRSKPPEATGVYTVGLLSISRTRTTLLAGREFYLSPTEHKVLLTLAMTPGEVVTFEQLYNGIWGGVDGLTVNAVKQHIVRIRQRLEVHPGAPAVMSIHSRGFMLRER